MTPSRLVRGGVISFRYVVADAIHGGSLEFLEAVEKIPAVTYMVSLQGNTLC